ncbi:potentiating neddylation domain-containing protein [Radiomyces spectabilis]|uniref:potentiating neddylation domain-containing protein n=1 Tax=Radiomyces spectabilis TaxID=64574 RepID=UPI00221F89F1|nr:potentiating neddylation domain-containing protein [Radiomyces spectabilis]KAI8369255.1 potentiating neddylation domain-containing protein [Radiomyces spectabilis]
MGYFTKEEWMNGMKQLGVDSADKLKQLIPSFELALADPVLLKKFYLFTFPYAKTTGQKSMDVDVAIALWQVIFADRYPHIPAFIQFLQEVKPVRVINKDQWSSLFDYIRSVPEDLTGYDSSSSWPVLFDDYVAWKKGNQDSM